MNIINNKQQQQQGPPAKPNGLSRSLVRPSDDATSLPDNIPGNAMACVELTHLQEVLHRLSVLLLPDSVGLGVSVSVDQVQIILDRTVDIADEICSSLSSLLDNDQNNNNNNNNNNLAKIIPYEIDGFGNAYYMV